MDRAPADRPAKNHLTICPAGFPGGTPDSLTPDLISLSAGEAAARFPGRGGRSS
jgi:hypothetical protein